MGVDIMRECFLSDKQFCLLTVAGSHVGSDCTELHRHTHTSARTTWWKLNTVCGVVNRIALRSSLGFDIVSHSYKMSLLDTA